MLRRRFPAALFGLARSRAALIVEAAEAVSQ